MSKRHRRSCGGDGPRRAASLHLLDERQVRWAWEDLIAQWRRDGGLGGAAPAIGLLAQQWAAGAPVGEVAEALLVDAIAALRFRGLDPGELVQLVSREAGALSATVVAFFADPDDHPCLDCWAEGLAEPLVEVVSALVAAAAMLVHIPRRPDPPPPPSAIEPKVLARVRALLAKAESTTFPDEADALTAKAHELMARHAIDRALLADGHEGKPASVRITVDDPYATAKSLLLSAVAKATRSKAVWSKQARVMTVFGFDDDLAAVELLYTSLLLQATTAMAAAGRGGDARGRSRGFRHAFLVAFASRIGRRLAESAATTVDEADREHAGSLLPVLARRDAAVDAAVAEVFPHLRSGRTSVSDPAGWAAGTTAADRAQLGRDGVGPPGSRGLGRG